MDDLKLFGESFRALTGNIPFRWQERLFQEFVAGRIPAALDLPTGLGKTSVMAVWLIARALADDGARRKLPRRLVYVVDRRVVVDQATAEAEKLRGGLEGDAKHFDTFGDSLREHAKQLAAELRKRLGLTEKRNLPISTLRGAHVDNREWLDDPTTPAIIVGTVDMIGSRLLFSGYGVSRKMRPFHAGLLGIDALVVLDEAHLVPPFTHLLRAIERDAAFCPKEKADHDLLSPFAVLPLSATQRDSDELHDNPDRRPFRLEEEDWKPGTVVEKRLKARKCLRLEPLADKGQDKQLAETALALAAKDDKFSRIVVFCNRRDRGDDGSGPSAQGVKDEIEKLAKGDKKAGRPPVEIYPPELLVGARRVRERNEAEQSLHKLGFVGSKVELEKPAFLLATAAGEVGADIDADHMVCDLVAWERMVQRLGRVNRRGECDAEVRVFWKEPSGKDVYAPTQAEKRALNAFASKSVIERLDQIDGAFDASPGALRNLVERARHDAALKASIDAATTPEPLRPPLTRALADAWSMTSLEEHAGRPKIQPWLRGWDDDEKSQAIVWRGHMPVRLRNGKVIKVGNSEINAFFDAAPPHLSEMLETETWRAAEWLFARIKRCLAQIERREKAKEFSTFGRDSIVLIVLDAKDELDVDERSSDVILTLGRLAELGTKENERERKAFIDGLSGRTLVVAACLGGLNEDGMLDDDKDHEPKVMDKDADWEDKNTGGEARPFRVSETINPKPTVEAGWKQSYRFVRAIDEDGGPTSWFVVEEYRDATETEESRALAHKAQTLKDHSAAVQIIARDFARVIGLPSEHAEMLAVAARLHDEGKDYWRWQRAFNAPHDVPYAKAKGPLNQRLLDGYRHEFGSLLKIKNHRDFPKVTDLADLLCHLVAAHHGSARPLISIRNADGDVHSHEACALEVTLRFARLQERWGPWGLAWWESLLRAADQKASRENDKPVVANSEKIAAGEAT